MTSSILPGTVLGERYRLEDLLDDIDGARFWRATDLVLERSVAVHVLRADDERVEAVLEAARRSATITDPHLLRVLDADNRDGFAWVINEWGAGQSLDVMVATRVLPPDRAAWLVREVATTIAVAHSHGLTHGRLAPENVMVTESGTVRLIGFAIDATIQRSRLRSGSFPDCTPQEADVLDLAGLLYTGLVGCWPGASGSLVKPAPRDAGGPMRPRQVRAGVPKPLDAICGRILARPHPDRTAHQLAAVLTEYIGELATTDPAVVPVALPETDASLDDLAAATGAIEITGSATTRPAPSAPVQPAEPASAWVSDLTEEVERPWEETAANEGPDATDATDGTDPDETARSAPVVPEGFETDEDWHQPRAEAEAPPAPLEPVPERPLFAPAGARRTPKGAVPRSVTTDWGTDTGSIFGAHGFGNGTGSGPAVQTAEPSWPLGFDPDDDPSSTGDDYEERTRRPWLRIPLLVLVVAIVAVVVAVSLGVGRNDPAPSSAGAGGGSSPSASATVPAGQRLKISGVKDLDPFATPPEENPDQVRNAIDNKADTAWLTSNYRGRADLGGLKPGVGLVVDLGSIQRIGQVAIGLVGSPTNLTLYAAPTAADRPTGIEGLANVGKKDAAGARAVLRPAQAIRARYLVVWLTSLPAVAGGFRGGISEIVVRS